MTQNVTSVKHMRFLRKPFQIIRANFRAYLIINAIVYGAATAWLAEPVRAPAIHRRRDLGGVLAPLPDSAADPMVVVA